MATVRLESTRFPWLALVLSTAAATAACQGGPHAPAGVPQAAAPPVAPAGPLNEGLDHASSRGAALEPSRSPTEGSGAVALAWTTSSDGVGTAPRLLAFVAQEDHDALSVVDVAARTELGVVPIAGGPTQVLVLDDGRLAVSLRWANAVALLDVALAPDARTTELVRRPTAAEPLGLAATPDGSHLLVATGLGRELASYSLDDLEPAGAVALPREPRSVLVDGSAAFVSHAIGSTVSAVSLDPSGVPVEHQPIALGLDPTDRAESPRLFVNQTFAMVRRENRLFVPGVAVIPGSDRPTQGYGVARPMSSTVRTIDLVARRQLTDARGGPRFGVVPRECLLPRGAAAGSDHTIWVACANADSVVELDARANEPIGAERRRFDVPAGPISIAVDERAGLVVSWSSVAERVAVIDVATDEVSTLALSGRETPRWSASERRGRALFRDGFEPRIAFDGRSCESCHPDGRDDGLTWSSPSGPRQTITLAGRVGERDHFGWFGVHRTLEQHLRHTMSRLGGVGFERDADAEDLDALRDWLLVMPAPSRAGAEPVLGAARAATVVRGGELFQRIGCGTCHEGGGSDGERHDVGTGHVDEASLRFLTPSLRGAGDSAPFLHTGAFASLDEMLAKAPEPMGSPWLEAEERAALVAYIEALPAPRTVPEVSGPLLPPRADPYARPASTGPYQTMLRDLDEDRVTEEDWSGRSLSSGTRRGVEAHALDVALLPFGEIAPLPDPIPHVGWQDAPMSPERVLAVAPTVAEWERDGVRVSRHRDVLELSGAVYGTIRIGDWHYSTQTLVAEHAFEERGRFVAVQIERFDAGEDGRSMRYREQAGFIDTHERRIHWWKRIDLPVAPLLGGDAFGARTRCAQCPVDERDQLLVVLRAQFEVSRWSVPLRRGVAAATSAFTLPLRAGEAWRRTVVGRVVALSLSWAQGETEPTLVGYVPARGPR